jgi:hypothetical protein
MVRTHKMPLTTKSFANPAEAPGRSLKAYQQTVPIIQLNSLNDRVS